MSSSVAAVLSTTPSRRGRHFATQGLRSDRGAGDTACGKILPFLLDATDREFEPTPQVWKLVRYSESTEGILYAVAQQMPDASSLDDFRLYLTARDDYERSQIVETTYQKLGEEYATERSNPVRIMTIRAAKGLTAPVVFIPGLESGILPSTRAQGRPRLLEEEARLLYVAINRATTACFMSLSQFRTVNGQRSRQGPSSLVQHLGLTLEPRESGLDQVEASTVARALE